MANRPPVTGIQNRITVLIASGLFTGSLPLAPGTFGSLLGLGIFLCVRPGPLAALGMCAVFLALGFASSGRAERIVGVKDAPSIVIDEIAGMQLSLLFVPFDPKFFLAAFFLFRILDTLKPFPAGRLQLVRGSAGIMLDDIIAAVYTNCILQVIARVLLKTPF